MTKTDLLIRILIIAAVLLTIYLGFTVYEIIKIEEQITEINKTI